jgi:hypothetical protein
MKTAVREGESWSDIAERTLGTTPNDKGKPDDEALENSAQSIRHLNGGAETPPEGTTVEVVGWDGTDRGEPTEPAETAGSTETPESIDVDAPPLPDESIDVDAPADETPAARDTRRAAKKK